MQKENEEFRISEDEFVQQLVTHQAVLRAYARRMVPDWALVDEAMQDASVVMWQKRFELRSLDGFLPHHLRRVISLLQISRQGKCGGSC